MLVELVCQLTHLNLPLVYQVMCSSLPGVFVVQFEPLTHFPGEPAVLLRRFVGCGFQLPVVPVLSRARSFPGALVAFAEEKLPYKLSLL